MTCSKCECLVRVKNKLGYNLYYCGYKKYGVLKALSGLYINNEEYRKDSETCKYYKGVRKINDEEIKLKRLRQAIEEDMTEKELFEIARERRYRINDLEKENKISEEIIIGEQQEINRLEKECSIYKNILMDILENQDLCFICRAKGKICQECFCGTTEECADSIYIMYEKENKQ